MRTSRLRTTAIVTLTSISLPGSQTWAGPTYTGTLAGDFTSGNTLVADGGMTGNDGWVQAGQPLVLLGWFRYEGFLA
jgi:hypothetical protein